MTLTADQRSHLESRLREERAAIIRILDHYIERFGAAEQVQSADVSKVDASLLSRSTQNLQDIDIALEKLYRDPERFGICEDTGREIPFERLDVVPWARICQDPG